MLSATINKLSNSYLPFFIFLFSMKKVLHIGVYRILPTLNLSMQLHSNLSFFFFLKIGH